jgi:hypothetical protein
MKSTVISCLLMAVTNADDKIVGTSQLYCSYYDGADAESRCANADTICCGKVASWDLSGFTEDGEPTDAGKKKKKGDYLKQNYDKAWASKTSGMCRSRTKTESTGAFTYTEEGIVYTYECQPEPAATKPKTADEIAAEKKKAAKAWLGKTCADEKVEADKTACTAAQKADTEAKAALKKKWAGKTCSDEKVAADKAACTAAQAGA